MVPGQPEPSLYSSMISSHGIKCPICRSSVAENWTDGHKMVSEPANSWKLEADHHIVCMIGIVLSSHELWTSLPSGPGVAVPPFWWRIADSEEVRSTSGKALN